MFRNEKTDNAVAVYDILLPPRHIANTAGCTDIGTPQQQFTDSGHVHRDGNYFHQARPCLVRCAQQQTMSPEKQQQSRRDDPVSQAGKSSHPTSALTIFLAGAKRPATPLEVDSRDEGANPSAALARARSNVAVAMYVRSCEECVLLGRHDCPLDGEHSETLPPMSHRQGTFQNIISYHDTCEVRNHTDRTYSPNDVPFATHDDALITC